MYSFKDVKKKKNTPVKTNVPLFTNPPVQLNSGAINITYYIEITTGGSTHQSYSGIDRFIKHVTTHYGSTVRCTPTDYTSNNYRVNFSNRMGSDRYTVAQMMGFLLAGATDYENELNGLNNGSTYSVIVRHP